MAKIELHPDFKDFLRLMNSHGVKYLLVGGYAVGYHGYPRATGDMDIWIAVNDENAARTASALVEFGMSETEVTHELFLEKDKIIRMGRPPVRIELITGASGVDFDECYGRHEKMQVDDVPVPVISLEDLKRNKKAAARHKDLDDLEHLP
jgi:predicted nucleotidyltransferase